VEVLPVGVAVDHGAAEVQFAHATLELVRGGNRVLHGEMGKSGIAVRPLADLVCQKVVGGARIADGGGGVVLGLDARTRKPKNRDRNAGAVHDGEALLAEIGQPRQRLFAASCWQVRGRRIPVWLEAWA